MNRQPVAIAAAIRAIILASVAFGLSWTAEQVAALMFAVEAVLVLFVQPQVTPNVTVAEQVADAKTETRAKVEAEVEALDEKPTRRTAKKR